MTDDMHRKYDQVEVVLFAVYVVAAIVLMLDVFIWRK
jgi:hypothetical protein